jgi:arsenite methyltransferase
MRERAQRWLLDRYGFDDVEAMREFFASCGTVLDAGCGSGFSASLWLAPEWSRGTAAWTGVDISAAVDVARERLAGIESLSFLRADILDLPFPEETFGAIFSEGVLHHTPSTERALKALVPLLRPGGELLFYVYRRKAPIREFTDDYVRGLVSALPPEDAWEALKPLTALGQALAELNTEVDVPDVPLLGIEAGRYDVQRLIYWNFAKLFWNAELSFDENVHVNFDWYHPRYAHRQTEEEVRRWCADAQLHIERFHVDPAGFTVRARRG